MLLAVLNHSLMVTKCNALPTPQMVNAIGFMKQIAAKQVLARVVLGITPYLAPHSVLKYANGIIK